MSAALLLTAALAAGPPARVDIDHPAAAGRKAVVLVFLGTDCPVSNGYAPVLRDLAADAARRGVAFLGVHPDPDVTAEKAAAHAREYGLDFPVLLDPDQRLARRAGVTTVPEAVVLAADGTVRYRGRIDDRYAPSGKRRPAATTRDLADAVAAVAAGKTPAAAAGPPFGCPLPKPRQRTKE